MARLGVLTRMDEQRFFDDDEEDGEPEPVAAQPSFFSTMSAGMFAACIPGHDDDGLRNQPAGSDVPDDVDEEVDVPGDAPTGPHRVACTLTLSEMELGHFDSIMRQEFCESLAEALAIDTDRITLVAARAGSVVVDAQVTVDDAEAATRLVSKLEDPAAALVDSKFGTCVITDVSSCPVDLADVPPPEPTPEAEPDALPGTAPTLDPPAPESSAPEAAPEDREFFARQFAAEEAEDPDDAELLRFLNKSVPPAPSRAEATPPLPNRADSDGGEACEPHGLLGLPAALIGDVNGLGMQPAQPSRRFAILQTLEATPAVRAHGASLARGCAAPPR